MAVAVILPKLDEAMRTGKITKWAKKEGEQVEKGEVIFEVETEKVSFEIEAEESGVLSKLMVKEEEEVPIGAVIAYILQPGEKAPEIPEPVTTAKEEAKTEAPEVRKGEETQAEVSGVRKEAKAVKASPLAKRLAKEHNIDLSLVTGTGPGGRITKEDILQAVEASKAISASPPAPEKAELAEEETISLTSMREVTAQRMMESFQSPYSYLTVEVDTQELGKTHEQLIPVIEAKTGIQLTFTNLLIKMVAKALEDNPSVNCAYADGAMKLFKRIDIGLVTAVEGGQIVTVIRQANKKSLAEIAQARADLAQRARENKITGGEMAGSTFTISNLGMFGIDQFSAILQPPEAAVLAVGRIADKAVVRNGAIVIRPMMTLTLSIDNRVLDGTIGSRFLQSLKNCIENPVTTVL